jgi:hypothetical protein
VKSKILGLLAVGLLAGPMVAQAVIISAGQTLRYDFDFTTSAVTPPYGSTSFAINWAGDLLNQSESFSLDVHDASGLQVGTYSYTFASPGGTTGLSSIINFSPLLATVDGYVLMHWQAGSANVNQLLLSMRTGTSANPGSSTLLKSATFVGVVPEPGMLVLLGIGTVGFGLSRRRTHCVATNERLRHSTLADVGAGCNVRDPA